MCRCFFKRLQAVSYTHLDVYKRQALDARASEINDEMKIAAAQAIASLVKPEELSPEFIIPNPFNKEVAPAVAKAVMEAAHRTGVARV